MTTLDSKIGKLLVRNGKLFGDCGCCDITDVPDICPETNPPLPFGINVSGTHSISFTPTSWTPNNFGQELAGKSSTLAWGFKIRWNLFSKLQFRFLFRPGTMSPVGIINELSAQATCNSFITPGGTLGTQLVAQSLPGFAARQTFGFQPDIDYGPFLLEGEVGTISINETTDTTGSYEYEFLSSTWSGTNRIDTTTIVGPTFYSCARVASFFITLRAQVARNVGSTVTPTIEGEMDYFIRLVY